MDRQLACFDQYKLVQAEYAYFEKTFVARGDLWATQWTDNGTKAGLTSCLLGITGVVLVISGLGSSRMIICDLLFFVFVPIITYGGSAFGIR